MNGNWEQTQAEPGAFHAVLTPYRSLGPTGFLILMTALGGISFVTGVVFLSAGRLAGAGLLRARRRCSSISPSSSTTARDACTRPWMLTPAHFTLDPRAPLGPPRAVRLQPLLGACELARMAGRAHGTAASSPQGKELAFARFLTDDERRDFASALREALLDARGGVRI